MHQEQFIYQQFRLSDDRKTAYFDYRVQHDGQAHDLSEAIIFPVPLLDSPEQLRSLRALHLALGINYYKIFVSPTIRHPYAMTETEAVFWNDIWEHGLGEFLYVNKLPVARLAQFAAQNGQEFAGESVGTTQGVILGIGGGKDSIVAGEMLKSIGLDMAGFVMATGEQLGQTQSVANAMGVDLHAIQRQMDMRLLELQEQPGGYKGHFPISLIFALVGTILAVAHKSAYVAVANEASSSIPRIVGENGAVNHQWSKSFGFEQKLQQFIHGSVDMHVTYFSAIRQLTSIGVAKLFAALSQYFEVFTSDNFVFRIDPAHRPSGRWSLESPKSLSSYLLLAPWLDDTEVQRIFGIDFLNEPSLVGLFLELTGVEGEPPLDCVGTVDELTLSVNLLAQADRYSDTVLMKLAVERGIVHDDSWDDLLQVLLELQHDAALPARLHDKITAYLQEHIAA